MNYNRAGGPPQQNLTPQQIAAQRQKMSMLPPQFQNLSPQQLQELKKKPQFQNALRQYYQRQQMAQQLHQQQQLAQLHQLHQPHQHHQQQLLQQLQLHMLQPGSNRQVSGGNSMFMHQTSMAPGSNNMNMGTKPPMNDPQAIIGGMNLQMNVDASHGNAPTMPQQMRNRNTPNSYLQPPQLVASESNLFGQPSLRPGMNPGQVEPMGANASGPSSMSGNLIGAGQKYPGQSTGQRQIPSLAIGPGGQIGYNPNPPVNASGSMPLGVRPLDPAFAMKNEQQPPPGSVPAGFVKEKIKVPSQFTPDVLSRITLTPLSSLNEWSEKFKKEDKEVPLDVKLYEDIIKKDDFFLRKTLLQTQSSKELLERMARDIKSYAAIKQLRMGAINAASKNQYSNSIWGEGYLGYGNGVTNTATQVVMPSQNKCFSKPGIIDITDSELNQKVMENIRANKAKELVPIRLEFDQERDRFKLRDTFLWDLNDTTYPLETFVQNLVDDYSFVSEINFQSILQSVQEQIKDYKPKPTNAIGEIRIPIKIDLLINCTQYTDQFEWDILSVNDNDPEEFANILCDEMNLPGEFATAIAFSIREQSQMYYKALALVGYSFDGSHIREDEIKSHMAPPLRISNPEISQHDDFISTLRTPSLLADFSPSINRISQAEIEKIEKELERDSRRRRRHNNDGTFSYNESGPNLFGSLGRGTASRRSALHSGRGVKTQIPDLSDVPKTFRTPIPSSVLPGGTDLGAPDIYGYNELVINRTQIPNPDHKPPAPPGMVSIYKDSAGSFFVKIKSRKIRAQTKQR